MCAVNSNVLWICSCTDLPRTSRANGCPLGEHKCGILLMELEAVPARDASRG